MDNCVQLLLNILPSLKGSILIVADENWRHVNWHSIKIPEQSHIRVFSNRLDIAHEVGASGIECLFCDFDFSQLPEISLDHIIFRVSKEKAITKHTINNAQRLLKRGASLLLAGKKKDGIKTYVKFSQELLSSTSKVQKFGINYFSSIVSRGIIKNEAQTDNYSHMRKIMYKEGSQFFSKPGIFGWNKIDRGSKFLSDNLETFFETYDFLPRTLLDLGCGYGYLACESRRFSFLNIFATDNNAAAIAACKLNFNHYGLNAANVLATDAGQKIVGNFDVILCNPPIHAGFRVDSALILKFLNSTQHLITKTGKALFVVDVCTPLELLAKNNFSRIHTLNKNNQFKLISLSH
ncbi:MAG: rRNA methyltransferase [Porticoccaceae bacterium]|nr:rRNA methyltransferase [Porticoccaceae bacterium]